MVDLPCWPFELFPLNELYWGKLVRSITLIPLEIFWLVYMYIRSQDGVQRARMCALSWPFELSPLDELYREKLVHPIFLVSYTLWYLVYMYVRSRGCVTSKNVCSPNCYPFELTLLNELYRWKRVSSIIVIFPLLALSLCIISSNIYTRLAVCNCLSFTLRLGDLPSLLMAISFTIPLLLVN